jgi:hypothetical protein
MTELTTQVITAATVKDVSDAIVSVATVPRTIELRTRDDVRITAESGRMGHRHARLLKERLVAAGYRCYGPGCVNRSFTVVAKKPLPVAVVEEIG